MIRPSLACPSNLDFKCDQSFLLLGKYTVTVNITIESPCRKKPKNGALYEQSTSCNLACIKAGQVYTFPPCVNNTIWTESYVQHMSAGR
jgi:hypothetical protein